MVDRNEQSSQFRSYPDDDALVFPVATDASEISAKKKLAAQFRISLIILSGDTFEIAAKKILNELTTSLDWDAGYFRSTREPTSEASCLATHNSIASAVWQDRKFKWIADLATVQDDPTVRQMRDEGFASAVWFPMTHSSATIGLFELYSRRHLEPDDEIVRMLQILSQQMSQLMDRECSRKSLLFQQKRNDYLSEATACMNSSLNSIEVFESLVKLAVPQISDFCSFRVLEGEELKLVAVAHVDPQKVAAAKERDRLYPVKSSSHKSGFYEAIRTKKSILVAELPREAIEADTADLRHLQLRREIDTHSYMCVPVVIRGNSYGVLTFVNSFGARSFNQQDLEVAEEVARRAALAIENAHLYSESQTINRIKDEFLATLSHELRTPLNVMSGYAEMLTQDYDSMKPDDIKQALEVIQRNVHVQIEMVSDLLDVSRIITGKIAFKAVQVSVKEIVDIIVQNFAVTALAKGVELTCDTKLAPLAIQADGTRLQQILWNLVSNAIKFTPSGGRVTVTVTQGPNSCIINVYDTGVGIDPEFQPYVFDRFRQEDSTTTKRYGGLGLGLSISRHLVELHGGSIGAVSEGKGKGTSMIVTLPIAPIHSLEIIPLPHATRSAQLEPVDNKLSDLHGLKALVIEDSIDSRKLLTRILTRAGVEVIEADSGQSARKALENFHPDVIVSDIGMPNESGIEFIRKLRCSNDSSIKHLPAIALTAYVRSEEKDQALSAGFQWHLPKPVNREALFQAITTLSHPHATP